MGARLLRGVVLVLALFVCCPVVPALADTLSYCHGQPAELEKEVPNLGTALARLKATSVPPPALTVLPELSAETQYVALPLGEGPKDYWAAFDPEADGGRGALYFDTDGDGDLAEETPAAMREDRNDIVFGPVAAELTRQGRTGPYHFCIGRYGSPDRYVWYFYPACCNVGDVHVGGKVYRMAVCDGEANGVFDDLWDQSKSWSDHAYVDWNGDGKFGSGESLYCTRRYLHDGQWYAVAFSADGREVSFTPASFPMGSVSFGDIEVAAQFVSTTGQGGFVTEGHGLVEVPADDYVILRCWVKRVAEDGVKWEASGSMKPGAAVHVTAGQQSTVALGPPFKASLAVQSKPPYMAGTSLLFEAKLTGADGKDYRFRAGTEQMPPPKMAVLSESGEELGSCAFQYG